jgi:hypothetical protein
VTLPVGQAKLADLIKPRVTVALGERFAAPR